MQVCKTVTFNNVIAYHESPVELTLELLEYREDDNSKGIVDKLRMKICYIRFWTMNIDRKFT